MLKNAIYLGGIVGMARTVCIQCEGAIYHLWVLKSKTAVSDDWIIEALNMGYGTSISRAVRAFREASDQEQKQLKHILLVCTD